VWCHKNDFNGEDDTHRFVPETLHWIGVGCADAVLDRPFKPGYRRVRLALDPPFTDLSEEPLHQLQP